MKTLKITLLAFLLATYNLIANVHSINLDKIEKIKSLETEVSFLLNNIGYYEQWTPKWDYDIKKNDLIKKLKELYKKVSLLEKENSKSIDYQLLLGYISHFLYNLEQAEYNQKAINHFQTALKINDQDYRPIWFLSKHLVLSAKTKEGVTNFLKLGSELDPKNSDPLFWIDYAMSTNSAFMTNHSIMGMEYAKRILGKPSQFEKLIGSEIRNKVSVLKLESNLPLDKIWEKDENIIISRPLGISFTHEKDWKVQATAFNNYSSTVTLKPPVKIGTNNMKILPSIYFISKVPADSEDLNDFIASLTAGFPAKNKIEIKSKYQDVLAYEFKDSKIYPGQGGAHILIAFISRNEPEFPGVKLEHPVYPTDKKGVNYYRAAEKFNRWKGKIFYSLMLEVTESVYPSALKDFENFLNNNLILE